MVVVVFTGERNLVATFETLNPTKAIGELLLTNNNVVITKLASYATVRVAHIISRPSKVPSLKGRGFHATGKYEQRYVTTKVVVACHWLHY